MPSPHSAVVDPSELREALDALPGYSGIVAGEMNDPAEVLCALFDSLNRVPELNPAGAPDQQGACVRCARRCGERGGRRLGVWVVDGREEGLVTCIRSVATARAYRHGSCPNALR